MSEEIRYPIGKFIPQSFSQQLFQQNLIYLRDLPLMLEYAITNLDESRLETPYREGGWTVKQLVHHVADSHMNAFIRCKLALTEDKPVIKPEWMTQADYEQAPEHLSVRELRAGGKTLVTTLLCAKQTDKAAERQADKRADRKADRRADRVFGR